MTDAIIEAENPAEVLRSQEGLFEITSPYGYVFEVTCRHGARMVIREIAQPPQLVVNPRRIWEIRRVRQLAS